MKAAFSLEFNVKDVIRMKKVKLIGTLLAAVIAAAPAAGLTGNVLPFNDNAIVADAAAYAPISRTVFGTYLVFRSNTVDPILSTGNGEGCYNLHYRNGRMVISRVHYAQGRRYEYNVKMYDVGGNSLLLQGDGNLVAYNCAYPDDFSRPTAHSNTWSFDLANITFSYTYKLTYSGELQIQRNFLSGQYKGKSDIIWRSSTGRMYKL